MNYVLVVEDDPGINGALRDLMEIEHINAQFAADGQEAINLVHSGKPCMVILDMTLPIIGGITVAHEIRNFYPDVPILAITADGRAREKAEEAKATAWLQKPFDLPTLLDMIYRFLDGAAQNHDRRATDHA